MYEREEQRTRDYYMDMQAAAGEVSEDKLNEAIRQGMRRGTARRVRSRRSIPWAAGALAAAVLLLFLLPWMGMRDQTGTTAVAPKSWGAYESYRAAVGNNITIKTALDAGLVQPVHAVSESVNGYQLTVDGILADRRGIIVLYSLQKETEETVSLSSLSLKFPGDSKGHSGTWSGYGMEEKDNRGYYQLHWEGEHVPAGMAEVKAVVTPGTPEAMVSSSNQFRTELTVGFMIDSEAIEAAGHSIELGKELSIAGQRIALEKAYIGPTGIYLSVNLNSRNPLKIFGLIYPVIVSGKDDQAVTLSSSTTLNTDRPNQTFIFDNDNMNRSGRLTFTVKGIHALAKDRTELVVNTETREVLKAPDDRLSWFNGAGGDSPDRGGPDTDLILDVRFDGAASETGGYFSLDDNFTDAEGAGHWLQHGTGNYTEYRGSDGGKVATYFFDTGKEALPQPLTFKINAYPNPIMESHSVRIR